MERVNRKNEDSILDPIAQEIVHLWRSRPGYEQVGAILNSIDAIPELITKQKQRPVLSHKSQDKDKSHWRLCFTIPGGIKRDKFIDWIPHFAEQAESQIEFECNNKTVILYVTKTGLPKDLPYAYEPNKKLYMPLPIGQSIRGFKEVDLSKVIHIFMGGQPGTGKTNAMRMMAVALIQNGALVVIIDLKKVDYTFLRDHALLATTLSHGRKVLAALNKELDRRSDVFWEHRIAKIQDYKGSDMPYMVLILDEVAEMQDKICQHLFNRLTRLSRNVGISVIAGTQRPSATIWPNFTDTRAQFAGAMCFRVKDAVNSRMVLDNDLGARLPRIPGRAIWQYDDDIQVQVPEMPDNPARYLPATQKEVNLAGNKQQPPKGLPPRPADY